LKDSSEWHIRFMSMALKGIEKQEKSFIAIDSAP
jgi:hypothetical protein